jgi:small nuclear ribonucleoprotein (snRNP)-like protein
MNLSFLSKSLVIAAAAGIFVASVRADVVETKSGARLVGKVQQIDGTVVVISTDYAGDIKVKQSEVVNVSTDAPLNVRLSSGTVLQGTLTGSGNGAVVIAGQDGTLNTTVSKVASTWAPGATDPQIAALARTWTYEATADVTGKTGNKEQLGTQFAVRAILKTPQDTLQFYSGYDRQVSDGAKSADQFKAGVDYQNNFSGKYSWYARDEGGFDRIKDIELYNIAAAGLGYDFIKEAKHVLTGRAGVSFRYEGYKNPATSDVKNAGLDFGFNHRWEFSNSMLVNQITFDPLFEDFGNFRIIHESYYEIPLTAPQWKLRVGVSNDYNSKPGAGVDKLDTTYFTRLVLNWK